MSSIVSHFSVTSPPSLTSFHLTSELAPQFRQNIRRLFQKLLFSDEKLGTNLEIGIYNYALKEATNRRVVKKWDNDHFSRIYIDRIHSVYRNLQPDTPDVNLIRNQLKDGTLTSASVAFMTHQEWNMEHWSERIEAKLIKDKNTFETTMEASTDTFTCPKPNCRKNKCWYFQLQTRSADEPMTTFVTCCSCGHRWRC